MPKTLSHRFEYGALRVLASAVSVLPRPLSLRFGASLGDFLYSSGVYLKIVRKNMLHVDLAPPERLEPIIRNLYRNIGRYASDFLRAGALPPYHVNNYEVLQSLLKRGKGIVVLCGHFGNWELLADIYGQKIAGAYVVAKAMRNDLVNEWLERKRTRASVTTIYTRNALRKMVEAVRHNGAVAILIDQYVGSQGTMVPFLGKDANTTRAVAGLVHKTGCAVMPTYALLRDDGSYDIHMTEAPAPDIEGLDDNLAIRAYQVQHNDILSSWIRTYPEHWFGWFHKRYRETVYYR
jgi:Kdo2-lipid IVA lauroyltransferase/acyltransferase